MVLVAYFYAKHTVLNTFVNEQAASKSVLQLLCGEEAKTLTVNNQLVTN
jgi:hypothetical protein